MIFYVVYALPWHLMGILCFYKDGLFYYRVDLFSWLTVTEDFPEFINIFNYFSGLSFVKPSSTFLGWGGGGGGETSQ